MVVKAQASNGQSMEAVSDLHKNSLTYYLSEFYHDNGDPRVSDLPMMRTPWIVISCCLGYLFFVLFLGPRLMRDRKPFSLFWFIRIYNLLMVGWNFYTFYVISSLLNYGLETFGCRPIDQTSRDYKSMFIIYLGYAFMISRLIEFIDTVCFVLRKKDRQISGFHVFHHFTVPIVVWFFLKFAPGGNSAVFPFLNSIVHTVMYSYYFLATFQVAKPFLFWKKWLTQMQIIQFMIMIAHSTQPLFINDCKFPKVFLYVNIFFSLVFIYLFTKFYIENYGEKTIRVAKTVGRRLSQQFQSGVRRLSQINTAAVMRTVEQHQQQQLQQQQQQSSKSTKED